MFIDFSGIQGALLTQGRAHLRKSHFNHTRDASMRRLIP